jgi:hypothetical protein
MRALETAGDPAIGVTPAGQTATDEALRNPLGEDDILRLDGTYGRTL